MASIYYSPSRDRWHVRWMQDGRQVGRSFRTEDEARTFAADNGHEQSPPGNGRQRTADDVREILRSRHEVDDNGCHIWTGTVSNVGYGQIHWISPEGMKVSGAHRLAYHLLVAPVAPGLVIDHLCRVRLCINPAHLDLVAQRENVMRSPIAPGAINAAKTHCAKGHPYSPENTYVYEQKSPRKCTQRICRTCRREYRQRWAARRAAAQQGVAA